MFIFYSLSILNAKQAEVDLVAGVADKPVISVSDGWTRVSWVVDVADSEPTEATVEFMARRQSERFKNFFLKEGYGNVDMVTLYTQIGKISDYRVVMQ